MELIY